MSLRAVIELAKAVEKNKITLTEFKHRVVTEIILIDSLQDVRMLAQIISSGADEEGEG